MGVLSETSLINEIWTMIVSRDNRLIKPLPIDAVKLAIHLSLSKSP
jgi:hypothetical protein